jgi:hypothetical protein
MVRNWLGVILSLRIRLYIICMLSCIVSYRLIVQARVWLNASCIVVHARHFASTHGSLMLALVGNAMHDVARTTMRSVVVLDDTLVKNGTVVYNIPMLSLSLVYPFCSATTSGWWSDDLCHDSVDPDNDRLTWILTMTGWHGSWQWQADMDPDNDRLTCSSSRGRLRTLTVRCLCVFFLT